MDKVHHAGGVLFFARLKTGAVDTLRANPGKGTGRSYGTYIFLFEGYPTDVPP